MALKARLEQQILLKIATKFRVSLSRVFQESVMLRVLNVSRNYIDKSLVNNINKLLLQLFPTAMNG